MHIQQTHWHSQSICSRYNGASQSYAADALTPLSHIQPMQVNLSLFELMQSSYNLRKIAK